MVYQIPSASSRRRAAGVTIALLALLEGGALRLATVAQEPRRPTITEGKLKPGSDVRDTAGLFGLTALESARADLRRVELQTQIATVIQTVESLHGTKLADVATKAARHSGIEGVFILVAKNEKEIELLVSKKYSSILTPKRQGAIRAGFIEGFKKGDYDQGLKAGVAALALETSAIPHAGAAPSTESANAALGFSTTRAPGPGSGAAMVIRNQMRLGLAGARTVIAGATAKAIELKLHVNVAVVDDGGHPIAFERMDGARPASIYTSITKATSAATFRQATGPLASGTTAADPLLNISLQNAAFASGGKITAL